MQDLWGKQSFLKVTATSTGDASETEAKRRAKRTRQIIRAALENPPEGEAEDIVTPMS